MSITIGGMMLATSDPWEALTILAAKRDAARALAAEAIAGYDAATAYDRTPEDEAELTNWRKRLQEGT